MTASAIASVCDRRLCLFDEFAAPFQGRLQAALPDPSTGYYTDFREAGEE